MTSPAHPTRRAVLSTLGVGWLTTTAGCDLLTDESGSNGDTPTGAPGRDEDEELLESVRTAVHSTTALLTATLTTHPELAQDLAPLSELHAVHLSALSPSPEETLAPATPAPVAGLARVVTEEEALLRLLTQSASEAESGRFARLLASMAAGLAQQISLLEVTS